MKRKEVNFSDRCLVFSKCNYICAKCGKKLMLFEEGSTIDHIIPLTRGGSNDTRNMVSMCIRCNQKKGDSFVVPRLYYDYLNESKIQSAETYYLENGNIFNNYNEFWLSFINSLT